MHRKWSFSSITSMPFSYVIQHCSLNSYRYPCIGMFPSPSHYITPYITRIITLHTHALHTTSHTTSHASHTHHTRHHTHHTLHHMHTTPLHHTHSTHIPLTHYISHTTHTHSHTHISGKTRSVMSIRPNRVHFHAHGRIFDSLCTLYSEP